MNIIEAATELKKRRSGKLVSEAGWIALVGEFDAVYSEHMVDGPSGLEYEFFGFFLEDLLSEKWTVLDE